jgi:hypothetical protein
MTTTNQKKNTTIPGMAYPATVLALATASSYPTLPDLSVTGVSSTTACMLCSRQGHDGGHPQCHRIELALRFRTAWICRRRPGQVTVVLAT